MKNNTINVFVLLMLFSFSSPAQDQGHFFIRGQVQKADKTEKRDVPLANATVALYKNGEKVTFKKTDKNGSFEFKDLNYGYDYKITFKALNCIEMFLVVDGNAPADKREYDSGVQSNFIMYDEKDKEIDAKKYNYPFMKILFQGKGLIIDKKYTENFNNGIIPEMKADQEKALTEQKTLAEKLAKEKQEAELKEKKQREEEELAKKWIKITGKLLKGEKPSRPIANVNVMLVNDKQEVVQMVKTNLMGSFVFNVYMSGRDYSIRVDENNNQVTANTKVTFTDKNDKELQTTSADSKGEFTFHLLANDTNTISLIIVSDSDLKIDLKGKFLSGDNNINKPLIDIKVNLVNKKAEILQTTQTDKEGSFAFKQLPSDQGYLLTVDENDPQLASLKRLLLTDENGNIVKEAKPDKDKKFKFELLPYEINKMGKMYVDDPWLDILELKGKDEGQTITERVYFNVNDEKLLPDAEKTLDKVISILGNAQNISIELSSHTDSQGADDYNMKLSEKRAKAAVDYMIKNGFSASKITGKGYGETKLLNNCGNGIKCSEEQHAKNRRLEFKVIKK